MTVFVGDDTVVQFRPRFYRLDLRIANAAREVYGTWAPETSYLGTVPVLNLLAYKMERIDGISYKEFRACELSLPQAKLYPATLCKDFARFLSRSWHGGGVKCLPLGQVGSSIRPRLISLSKDLPPRFRPAAQNILGKLHQIESLPWVLTHGDVVPENILVDRKTGSLKGFVDWAEAEILPFGICIYGLEQILGRATASGFQYYPDALELRSLFWTELCHLIPALRHDEALESVKLARDLGVMLWHGIAFDDGAINRVVQEGRDIDEIRILDSFLEEQLLLTTAS